MDFKIETSLPNLYLHWTKLDLDKIKEKFPDAYLHQNNLIARGFGRFGLHWLSPLDKDITWVHTGRLRWHLARFFSYSLPDIYCQINYGDRNLTPIDELTKEKVSFRGITRGFASSSTFSSHFTKTQLKRGKDETEHKKMQINFARNRLIKVSKYYPNLHLYLAKLDSGIIKFGVTRYEDINHRKLGGYGNNDGSNYDKMIKLCTDNSSLIVDIEYQYKLRHLNTDETLQSNEIEEFIDYLNFRSKLLISKQDILEFCYS